MRTDETIKNNEGYYAKYNNQTISTGDDIAKTGMLIKIPKESLIKKGDEK